MLRFRKRPISFVGFLLVIVALGGAPGYLIDAIGLAAFCFFVALIEAKPSWKFLVRPAREARQWARQLRSQQLSTRRCHVAEGDPAASR
jgi:hypothetical protein